MKEEQIHTRISKADKKLLEKDAKDEQRSVSNLLLWCWRQWRRKK
jgi:uncharacterized protein (DUF1778 family)